MNFTADQQRVIDTRNSNILVSAAAGSGKTAVLVERIIQRITDKENPVDIDRLLIVTFTSAAAAQMRERISKAVAKGLEEQPENEHLQRQASLIHNAQITTIDSFCLFVIRNHFNEIGIDPAFRVADESEIKMLEADVMDRLLEEKHTEPSPRFLRFVECYGTGTSEKRIEEAILRLYHFSMSYPFPEEWLLARLDDYRADDAQKLSKQGWFQEALRYIDTILTECEERLRQALAIAGRADGPAQYVENLVSDLELIETLKEAKDYEALYDLFTYSAFTRLSAKKTQGEDPVLKETVKRIRDDVKKSIANLKKQLFQISVEDMLRDMAVCQEAVEELAALTLSFKEMLDDAKRDKNIIDFSDMEHFALQILLEKNEKGEIVPRETALALREYFAEIMIDEYQDSNEVQELLLKSISGEGSGRFNRFMVGDVKQSIYKFRMAKPEIFLHKYGTFSLEEGEDRRIDLSMNFRSRAGVLESANWIFESVMQEGLGGIRYDEAARLVPGMVFDACDHPAGGKTELVLIEQKSGDVTLERKSLEAAVIGEKIRGMVQGDDPLYVQGKHGYRPVSYGDVAILLRSVTGWAEEFVGVLNDMGIPAFADTRTGYFDSLEVETILNFLHVIDNPRQDIPLAAVLRSCLGELTDEELAWIGTMEGDLNYLDQVESYLENGENDALREKLGLFMDQLHGYRSYGGTHSVYELLRKIYDETGYYQYMSAMPSGEKRRANLDILLQQSLEFARNGHRGIYGFARYIECLQKSEVDFGEAVVDGENANAVRIMTIHKSKGLEFPVVFVAGMGKKFNLMDARKSTVIDSEFGVGCDFVDLDLRVKQPTLAKKFVANQVVLGTLAEEIRVLYVALTRAKEKLFITGTASDVEKKVEGWAERGGNMDFSALSGAQTYLDWIAPVVLGRRGVLEDQDELFRVEVLCPEDAVTAEVEEQKRELSLCRELREMDTANVFDEDMREALERQGNYRYPYQSEAELPVKMSVSELKRRSMIRAEQMEEEKEFSWEEMEIPRPAFLQGEKELSGAARGTLYHMVMEHFPYEKISESGGNWSEKDFDGFLEEMIAVGYMTDQERRVLDSGKFVAFLASDIGQRMARAHREGNLWLEQPFMMGLPAGEIYPEQDSDAMIMVQGIIDAFFFQGEEIVLVDYKTDSARSGQEGELVEKYRAQLDYYAKALERLTGKKVAERLIYSFALGEELRC